MLRHAEEAAPPLSLNPVPGRTLGTERRALTHQVVDVLAEKVISGEFAEGELLPSERQLCTSFNVSRTVIREAIKALESRGLVRIAHGRGTVAQTPPVIQSDSLRMLIRNRETLLDDLLDIRRVLEVHMAQRAAERRTEENLARMEHFIEVMRSSPAQPEGYVCADVDFHMEIARATQNPVLMTILAPVSELSRESRRASFLGSKMVKLRAQQHQEIFDCIRARDAKGAAAAMSRHLADTGRDLRLKVFARTTETAASSPDAHTISTEPQSRTTGSPRR